MSKKGREFEKLVAGIEKSLAPYGAIITSPHKIKDRDTGGWREVDATIQHKIGPTDILIAIECRDRSVSDDVVWIEQLATKQISIGASKMIAVSSRGFTAPAIEKAEKKGIETRTLRKIKPKDIKSWITLITLDALGLSLIALGGSLEIYAREGDAHEVHTNYLSEDKKWLKIFLRPSSQRQMNIPELFLEELSKERPAYLNELEDKGPQEIWIERNYEVGELSVKSEVGDRFVKNIRAGFECTLNKSVLRPSSVHAYTAGLKILANRIEFNGEVHFKNGVLPIKTLLTSIG